MRKYQLDGIRFVLFLMVFTTHYHPVPAKVAYLGYALPVFFVMSGFLITNVLVSCNDPTLLGKLKIFYLRRILRICPSYYFVVAILFAIGALTYPIYYLFYFVNIKLFSLSLSQTPGEIYGWFMGAWKSESLHLWSLSVEEQFYILYPLVLYLTPMRWRTAVLFLLLIASIASRFWFMSRFPQSFYGTLLPVCMEYFVWGCIFAWFEIRNRLAWLSPSPVLTISTVTIVTLIAMEHYLAHSGFLQFTTTHYQTPIALGMGFFVWALWSIRNEHIVARILSWKPLVYFGAMSYTLYLVHLLALDAFIATGIDLPFSKPTDRIVGAFITSLLIAIAIWHWIEKPVYSLRRFVPYGRVTSLASAAEPRADQQIGAIEGSNVEKNASRVE